jgi:hypothetical protein
MSSLDLYTHTPLQHPQGIRLLKLQWWQGTEDDAPRLECIITVVSLDNAPAFHGLSYTWESQSPTETLICGNRQLFITPNCFSALSSIAQDDSLREHLYWVDSICIDQTSIRERNHQVALMAEIYRLSSRVVIWLGESDTESLAAMEELKLLVRLVETDPVYAETYLRNQQKKLRRDVVSHFTNQDLAIPFILIPEAVFYFLHPLADILSKSWFERLWTLQEIVLAEDALVKLGDHSIS